MKDLMTRQASIISLMSAILIYVLAISCEQGPPKGSRAAQAMRGKAHFTKYCVQCHGADGKGIKVDSLITQPADLTKIMRGKKNKPFPIKTVARMIDGRKMPKSHGTREMPIWGEVFSEVENLDETEIKGKMGELIAYLMSIQSPS